MRYFSFINQSLFITDQRVILGQLLLSDISYSCNKYYLLNNLKINTVIRQDINGLLVLF